MNGINGYSTYDFIRSTAYTRTKEQEAKKETGKAREAFTEKETAVNRKESPKLSEKAQSLLDKIKEKYGEKMDFMVASYSSEEEAQRYLSGGTKEYSVLINPELLEKMASEKDGEKKISSMIEDATSKLSDVAEKLGEDSDVVRLGVSFDQDGNASYFAELEKGSAKQRERIENARAEKKEQAAKEKKAAEKKAAKERLSGRDDPYAYDGKRTTVYADSIDDLLEKIRSVDWDKVPQTAQAAGSHINYNA